MEPATLTLNDNAWHKVHITRDGRNVRLNIDNGAVDSELLSSCRQGIDHFRILTAGLYLT